MIKSLLLTALLLTSTAAYADTYIIDTKGGHAAINFKFKHVGISWLLGEFKTFEGGFEFDENDVEASSITVDIDTTSLDSNHAERDKHIRDERYLDVDNHPTAKFVSTSFTDKGEGNMTVNGDLTLRGVTKPIAIEVSTVGKGETRWKDYRIGLEGETTINTQDFGMESFGPEHMVHMLLYIEGIKQ